MEAFLDEIVLAVLTKFHNRMFSSWISSLVLDFITDSGRGKPLWGQISVKVLLILNCFFPLALLPQTVWIPEVQAHSYISHLMHQGKSLLLSRFLCQQFLKQPCNLNVAILWVSVHLSLVPVPAPCKKTSSILWVYREGRRITSIYFAHKLALINWHTILSFVIYPSQIEVQG